MRRLGAAAMVLVCGGVACSSSSAKSVGNTQTSSGRTCEGFDTDGDGKVDEVDCNGDGTYDGADVDGDGVATVWDDLTTGLLDEPNFGAFDAPNPDNLDELDAKHLPQHLGAGGTIDLPPAVQGDIAPGALKPLNQGAQLSCAAFASSAVGLAAALRREGGDPNAAWPSQQLLYRRLLAASFPGQTKCEGGTYIHEALNTLVLEGAPALAASPYDGASGSVCNGDPKNLAGHRFRIGGWSPVQPATREHLKKALSAGLVVPFGVALPAGFPQIHGATGKQPYKGGGKCTYSAHCGGHAMAIIGYDDARGAFRVLNSWGTDWGDGGYLWWDYDALLGQEGFAAFQVTLMPDATPFAPVDVANFKASVVGSAWAAGPGVTFRVSTSEPLQLASATLTTAAGTSTLDLAAAKVSVWVAYGDVSVPAQVQPTGAGTLVLKGTLRGGADVTRSIDVTFD